MEHRKWSCRQESENEETEQATKAKSEEQEDQAVTWQDQ